MLSKVVDFFKHPLIQIALATGASIIVLALFFKKIMGTEVPATWSAIPALMIPLYELARVKKWRWLTRTWVPITLILVSTILIIIFHAI